MPLDPQIEGVLAVLKMMPSILEVPLEVMRAFEFPKPPVSTPVAESRDLLIATGSVTIPGRLYRPRENGVLPLLVFFHGGGFVVGDLESYDEMCRGLALAGDCAVLAVHYRLAPEHKFPAATDDALGAARWAARHANELGIDPARIAVGGDSAGGNLAAVTALRARGDEQLRLIGQLLIYPVTASHTPPTRSYIENGEGYLLTRDIMKFFIEQYLPDEAASRHPHFSVLSAPDLAALPAAYVVTAQYDPLRDEGEAYAERLRAAGVAVELVHYDGAIHGFFAMHGVDLGQQALKGAGDWLRALFRR
jgi:acetyl esterase